MIIMTLSSIIQHMGKQTEQFHRYQVCDTALDLIACTGRIE